jgi:hypothetical protein
MHRVVIVFVMAILALAVVGCGGSDEAEPTEITESPALLATQQPTNTPVPTEPPTNTPVSTEAPTNTLPTQPVVNTEANLRAGPGIEYDKIRIASAGQGLELIATNPANDWYKLASGEWIAAFLVDNPPDGLPVVEAIPALPQVAEEPPTQAPQEIGAQVRITGMLRNGRKGENEPDEYVEMMNVGDAPQDMTGWRLESTRRGDDTGQIFYFPQGFVILPSQTCRIYTNQDEPEWCGLNFRHEQGAIWNNHDSDAALLYDQAGNLVGRWE